MSDQKQSILSKILTGIKNISNHIFALLRYGRINVIAVFAIYFALWFSPQGQDILVGMPESHMRVMTSFVLIFAMALLNWYFPRLFYPVNEHLFDSLGSFLREIFNDPFSKFNLKKFKESRERGIDELYTAERSISVTPYDVMIEGSEEPVVTSRDRTIWEPARPESGSMAEKVETMVSQLLPRALGISTFLVLAGGLMLIYLRYNLEIDSAMVPLWLSILVVGLSYGFSWGLNKISDWLSLSRRWLIFLIILFILMSVLGLFGNNSNYGLPFLALSLIFAALIFGIFVSVRTKVKTLGYFFDDFGMAGISFWVILISFISFIVLNMFPSVAGVFPLNALLQGLIFYVGLTSLLVFLGKSKQTYFLSLTIIGLIILSNIWKTDLHKVSTVEKEVALTNRVLLDDYLDRWFEARRANLPDSALQEKFPLFIIMGEGGGSRAAYWTNLTLGAFHKATQGRFQDHTLAITTVSGSSFGAAVHLAQLHHEKSEGLPEGMELNTSVNEGSTFEGNYLSTSLVQFMGGDFWRTVLPPLYYISEKDDRAHHLEWEWSRGVQRAITKLGGSEDVQVFQKPYLSHYYDSQGNIRTDLPLYLPNTTHVGTGNRSLISPIKIFDDTDHSTEVFDFVGMQGRDLPLATAALLSARFPYINPGGVIGPDDQFVDGGYYENIGGVTAKELLDKTESYLEANGLDSLVEIHLLTIFNGKKELDAPPVSEKTDGSLAPQALVPVNAFVGTPFSGHTNYWPAYFEGRLEDQYHKIYLNHELRVTIDSIDRKVIMPLARYLSKSAGAAIRKNAVELEKTAVFRELCDLVN